MIRAEERVAELEKRVSELENLLKNHVHEFLVSSSIIGGPSSFTDPPVVWNKEKRKYVHL